MKQMVKYIVRDTAEPEVEVLRKWANRMIPDWQVHSDLTTAQVASDMLPGSAIYKTTTQMEKLP